MSKSQRR